MPVTASASIEEAMTDDSKPVTDEDLDEMVSRAIAARTQLTECGIDVSSLDDVGRLVAEVRRLRGISDKRHGKG
jgi:hypothetical protein